MGVQNNMILIYLVSLIFCNVAYADYGQEKILIKAEKACQGCAASDVEIKGMSFDEVKKQIQKQQLIEPETSQKNQIQNQDNKNENSPNILERR